MSNREWENISDKDFEAILESTVSELPPEDIVTKVTPFKRPINHIMIGMTLTVITLNFWCLNYILPIAGTIMLLLGFRTLRYENKWFKSCFIMSIIQTAYLFSSFILNTTIIKSTLYTPKIASVLIFANLLLLIIKFICLWRGFISVQQKSNLPPHAGGAVALIVWYAFIYLLTLIQYSGLLIALIMIIGYFFIIRNLYKLSKELDEAGYAIKTAPIKITDRCIVISLVSVLLIGSVCGYVFGGSYPMKWSNLNSAEHNEIENIKAHLLSLGFPEYVLNDLSAEDIAACDGALQVVVYATDNPVNYGRTEIKEYGNTKEESIVYDVKELRMTGIGVHVPGKQERWIIFHHFLWTTNPGFYGTECIQLSPACRLDSNYWHSAGDVTGRILYDDNGNTFVADYYSLGWQTFTSNSIFGNSQSSTDIFAAFSMPRNGHNHRGYVAYPVDSVDEVQEWYVLDSWLHYMHQQSWLQYPVRPAIEMRMANGWINAGAFKTIPYELLFYPKEEYKKFK